MNLSFMPKYKSGKRTEFVLKILISLGYDKSSVFPEFPKIHTIRNDPKNRWVAGRIIHFCTGLRTRYYKLFALGTCISTQEVRINNHGILTIVIDGRQLMTKEEVTEFVRNDGFETEGEFEAWFSPLIEQSWRDNQTPYIGKLIHWTNKRY